MSGRMQKINLMLVLIFTASCFAGNGEKIVIAHRGASGYLPEHTLAAKAMAYAMKADYLEQDLVMTKDDQLVVMHDINLDRVTNVDSVFPERKRKDGKYYVIDFTLTELQALLMTEGFDVKDGVKEQSYKGRFPMMTSNFKIHTFQEEIELIQGLNKSTGMNVGIYPEIKQPALHLDEGKDISKQVLQVLKQYGYVKKTDLVYLQCFDPREVKRIHDELLPEFGMDVSLIMLIGNADRDENGKVENELIAWMYEKGGMDKIATIADGIGPDYNLIVEYDKTTNKIELTDWVERAHKAGLKVHPYTIRSDRLPEYVNGLEPFVRLLYEKADVDGAFTDFPDRVVEIVQ